MAERFYFTSNAFSGPVYPADSNWNDTAQCTTQSSDMVQTPSGDAPFSQTAQKNSAANPHSIVHIRYKFPLSAGVFFTGNIRGQHFCQCPGNLGGMRAISVRIFDSGTSVQATLLQDFASSISSDFGTTMQNRFFPPSTAMATTYTTVAGDVLVVELGTKWFTPDSGGTVTAAIRFGDNGVTDLPVDETTGVGAPEENSWLEFEDVSFEGILDDPLPTFSGTLQAIRPTTPSKEGLHFFDRSTNIESIWNGTAWKEMVSSLNGIGGNILFANTTDIDVTLTSSTFTWNAQGLSAQADRSKIITLTEGGVGPTLTASGPWTLNGFSLQAPGTPDPLVSGGATPLVVGPNGTMGRGSYPTEALMRHNSMTFTTPGDAAGWVLSGISQTGAGGLRAINCTSLALTPAAPSTTPLYGIENTYNIGNANMGGPFSMFRGRLTTVTGTGATRGTFIFVDLASGVTPIIPGTNTIPVFCGVEIPSPTIIATGVTITDMSLIRFRMGTITTAVNTISEANCLKQGTTAGAPIAWAANISGPKRWMKTFNSSETRNDWICEIAAKGLITKDAQGTPEYWRLHTSGTGLKGATINIDADGFGSTTRTAAATGVLTLNIVDVGTAAPTT